MLAESSGAKNAQLTISSAVDLFFQQLLLLPSCSFHPSFLNAHVAILDAQSVYRIIFKLGRRTILVVDLLAFTGPALSGLTKLTA